MAQGLGGGGERGPADLLPVGVEGRDGLHGGAVGGDVVLETGAEAAVREGDHGVRGVGVRPRGEERLPVAQEVLEDAVGVVHLDEPGSFGGALFNLPNKLQKRRVGAAEEEAIHAGDAVLGELGLEACAGQGSGDLVVELVHVRTAGRELRRALGFESLSDVTTEKSVVDKRRRGRSFTLSLRWMGGRSGGLRGIGPPLLGRLLLTEIWGRLLVILGEILDLTVQVLEPRVQLAQNSSQLVWRHGRILL